MDERTEQLSNLFNTITVWTIAEMMLAIGLTVLAVHLAERIMPPIANLMSARWRQRALNVLPIYRLIAIVILILWLIPLIFNVSFENFVYVAGGLGVALGFALRDVAGAMIAGLVAIFEKPYRPGDWVRIGDDYGEVVSIGLRALQLRTPDDTIIVVPHEKIWDSNIGNANDGTDEVMCVAEFHVAFGQPTENIVPALRRVAQTSAYLNLDKEVIVVMDNALWGMTYRLKAYPFEPRDQFAFITDLCERGNAALASLGVQMAPALFEPGLLASGAASVRT